MLSQSTGEGAPQRRRRRPTEGWGHRSICPQAVRTAAQAEDRGYGYAAANDAEMIGKMRDKGMTIGSLPAPVLAELRRIGGVMQREWVEKAGPDGAKLLEEFRAGA